jgi:hypothetical protein
MLARFCLHDNDLLLILSQVPPAELEHILQSHPEIADAAVIP